MPDPGIILILSGVTGAIALSTIFNTYPKLPKSLLKWISWTAFGIIAPFVYFGWYSYVEIDGTTISTAPKVAYWFVTVFVSTILVLFLSALFLFCYRLFKTKRLELDLVWLFVWCFLAIFIVGIIANITGEDMRLPIKQPSQASE